MPRAAVMVKVDIDRFASLARKGLLLKGIAERLGITPRELTRDYERANSPLPWIYGRHERSRERRKRREWQESVRAGFAPKVSPRATKGFSRPPLDAAEMVRFEELADRGLKMRDIAAEMGVTYRWLFNHMRFRPEMREIWDECDGARREERTRRKKKLRREWEQSRRAKEGPKSDGTPKGKPVSPVLMEIAARAKAAASRRAESSGQFQA